MVVQGKRGTTTGALRRRAAPRRGARALPFGPLDQACEPVLHPCRGAGHLLRHCPEGRIPITSGDLRALWQSCGFERTRVSEFLTPWKRREPCSPSPRPSFLGLTFPHISCLQQVNPNGIPSLSPGPKIRACNLPAEAYKRDQWN